MTFDALVRAGRVLPEAERRFERPRDRLYEATQARTPSERRTAVERWIAVLDGAWREVFSPVVSFLKAYAPAIYSHPLCLGFHAPWLSLVRPAPANVMTLAVRRSLEVPCLSPSLGYRR